MSHYLQQGDQVFKESLLVWTGCCAVRWGQSVHRELGSAARAPGVCKRACWCGLAAGLSDVQPMHRAYAFEGLQQKHQVLQGSMQGWTRLPGRAVPGTGLRICSRSSVQALAGQQGLAEYSWQVAPDWTQHKQCLHQGQLCSC